MQSWPAGAITNSKEVQYSFVPTTLDLIQLALRACQFLISGEMLSQVLALAVQCAVERSVAVSGKPHAGRQKVETGKHCTKFCWRYKTIQLLYTWILCKRITTSHLTCKEDVKDVDAKHTKRNLVLPDQAMFCTCLSHFGMLHNCYQDREFLRGV